MVVAAVAVVLGVDVSRVGWGFRGDGVGAGAGAGVTFVCVDLGGGKPTTRGGFDGVWVAGCDAERGVWGNERGGGASLCRFSCWAGTPSESVVMSLSLGSNGFSLDLLMICGGDVGLGRGCSVCFGASFPCCSNLEG